MFTLNKNNKENILYLGIKVNSSEKRTTTNILCLALITF